MKKTQIINIICSLLLASLLILSVVLAVIISAGGGTVRLVVASVGMQKEYDGTPLTAHSYEILSGKLKNGHSIRASFSGSQTEVGTSENTFSIRIVDESGNNVTDDYEIELVFGKLNVTRKPTPGGGGDGPGGNASPSVGGGSQIDLGGRLSSIDTTGGGNELCLRVKNKISDTIYLKVKSFGAYTGVSWEGATEYNNLIKGELSASYLSSLAIGKEDSVIEIKSFTDQYFLPYYMSAYDFNNCDRQISDVMYSGNTEDVYSVTYGRFDYTKSASLPYTYNAYEKKYKSFVESQYLEIDSETREYMDKIIRANGFYSGTRLETVIKIAEYIKNSATYSLNYDRELDVEENIAVAFLEKYKEGVCQHYASAATLLYRAMGIPARYTVGFVVDTEAEEWIDVKGKSAHAWVEVYINGMGWVMIEVTNGFEGPGEINDFAYSAQITPVLTDKQYDGTPLYAQNRVTGFEEYEAMGYTYSVAVNGSRTELGKSTSIIESFTVYDRNGRDVTDKFDVTFNTGTVHVYLSELVFVSGSATKVYDGYELYTDISTCKMVSGTLREGDRAYPYSPFCITDVSVSYADFWVGILDESGHRVDNIYKITKECGLLTITPREITIKAADATKVYDGYTLSRYSYQITEGSIANGDFIYLCRVEGIQYDVGRSDNVIKEVLIMNQSGALVTNNYIIKLEPGTLQILPKS